MPSKRATAGQSAAPPSSPKIKTVSHTLRLDLAERLRTFAFSNRVSESSVIEIVLDDFFNGGQPEDALIERVRGNGATLRRRSH